MKFKFLLSIPVLGLLASGCNIINPAEKAPTYVRIDSFQFNTIDAAKEGSASQKITSAWVYFNNEPLGVFDLPANIPVLADKPGVIQVTPGVVYAGLQEFVSQYPFFRFDTISISPAANSIIRYTPNTNYYPDAKFHYKEDFEVGNTFITIDDQSTTDTSLVRTNENGKVFEGNGSGYIYLDGTHNFSEVISNNGFPITNANAYLEINYKCNTEFVVGLQTVSNGSIVYEYIAGAKPRENWNKLYIGLSSFISNYKGTTYRVVIKSTLPEGQADGYVLLDNLKVVSF